jgi:hypothetical protein
LDPDQDVLDPVTAERHRCIIAKIELFDSTGKSLSARPVDPVAAASDVSEDEMKRLIFLVRIQGCHIFLCPNIPKQEKYTK